MHFFHAFICSKIKVRLVQKGVCMMEQANRILTVLEEAGYEAYIIGGAVRDILMHQKPHDFDIVTSARPDTVIDVLRNASSSKRFCGSPIVRNVLCLISRRPPTKSMTSP